MDHDHENQVIEEKMSSKVWIQSTENSNKINKDHVPSTLPIGPTKLKPPPGLERWKLDPKTQFNQTCQNI